MNHLLFEFIGTFIFFMIILKYGEPIPIAIGLAAVIFFSGGHFNPGVSLMMYLKNNIQLMELLQYILIHGLASLTAVYFNKITLK